MIFALATTVLWSLSTVIAHRSQRVLGPLRANVGRLAVALVFLAAWAFTFGQGCGGPWRGYFLLSGVVGLGLGDLAFFAALARIGSRLTVVLTQCLSVPIAILVEWLWLGTRLTGAQLACGGVVLAGIAVALWPARGRAQAAPVTLGGVLGGVLAAAGQGVGAVVSRKGFELAAAAGDSLDGPTSAFLRIAGGLAFTLTWFAVRALWRDRRRPRPPAPAWSDYRWPLANALVGPILGMSTYQMALSVAPSGLVLPITATTPLVIIPFAYWLEGERPLRRSLVGGLVAVAGAVALALV